MAAVNHRALLDAAPRGSRVVATYFTTTANTYQEVYWPPLDKLAAVYLSVTVADGRYCGCAATGSASASAADGGASTPADFPVLTASGAEVQLYAAPDGGLGSAATPAQSISDFVTSTSATTRFHYVYVRK